MRKFVKAILCVISWFLFFVLILASVVAVISTVMGVAIYLGALIFPSIISAADIYGSAFFASSAVITLICLIFSVYEWIKRVFNDRKLKR